MLVHLLTVGEAGAADRHIATLPILVLPSAACAEVGYKSRIKGFWGRGLAVWGRAFWGRGLAFWGEGLLGKGRGFLGEGLGFLFQLCPPCRGPAVPMAADG
jgi:hypothetical protein